MKASCNINQCIPRQDGGQFPLYILKTNFQILQAYYVSRLLHISVSLQWLPFFREGCSVCLLRSDCITVLLPAYDYDDDVKPAICR